MCLFSYILYFNKKFSLKIFYRFHIVLEHSNPSAWPKDLYDLVLVLPFQNHSSLPLPSITTQTSHHSYSPSSISLLPCLLSPKFYFYCGLWVETVILSIVPQHQECWCGVEEAELGKSIGENWEICIFY